MNESSFRVAVASHCHRHRTGYRLTAMGVSQIGVAERAKTGTERRKETAGREIQACAAGLSRRDRQEPNQQSEQDQSPEQRKGRVQGMKLEVGIALTMPRGEHRDLLLHARSVAMDGLLGLLSHFEARGTRIYSPHRNSRSLHSTDHRVAMICSGRDDRMSRRGSFTCPTPPSSPADPSGRPGFQNASALPVGRSPDRDRTASAARLRRRVRWPRLRS